MCKKTCKEMAKSVFETKPGGFTFFRLKKDFALCLNFFASCCHQSFPCKIAVGLRTRSISTKLRGSALVPAYFLAGGKAAAIPVSIPEPAKRRYHVENITSCRKVANKKLRMHRNRVKV